MASSDFWTGIVLIIGTIAIVGVVLERALAKGFSEIVEAIRGKPPTV